MPGRQVAADALRRERRGGVLAGAGQRRRRGHAAHRRRRRCCAGTACRRPTASSSRTTTRTSSSGSSTSRRRRRRRSPTRPTATSTTWRGRRTAKWLAYTAPGRQPADAHLPLRDRDGAHRAGRRRIATTAAARRGARTASGSTSCRTATSSRSSAAPWGSRQPEPFFDRQTKIYHVALKRGERSPFQPDDELQAASKADATKPAEKPAADEARRRSRRQTKPARSRTAGHREAGGRDRPRRRGRRRPRDAAASRCPFRPATTATSRPTASASTSSRGRPAATGTAALKTLAIENKKPEPETFIEDPRATSCRTTARRSCSARARDFYVVDAGAKAPADLSKSTVPLGGLDVPASTRAPSGGRCSPRRGGSSATTSTTAACTASTGRRCARSTCRWSIASPTAPS